MACFQIALSFGKKYVRYQFSHNSLEFILEVYLLVIFDIYDYF